MTLESFLDALSAGDERLLVWTAIACVIVSIVVHGITAGPLSRFLAEHVVGPPPAAGRDGPRRAPCAGPAR